MDGSSGRGIVLTGIGSLRRCWRLGVLLISPEDVDGSAGGESLPLGRLVPNIYTWPVAGSSYGRGRDRKSGSEFVIWPKVRSIEKKRRFDKLRSISRDPCTFNLEYGNTNEYYIGNTNEREYKWILLKKE